MKRIFVWSQKPNYGKNTITFNIATKISSKKNKCSIVSSKLPEEMIELKRKHKIKCFDIFENNKHLISYFLNSKRLLRIGMCKEEFEQSILSDFNEIKKNSDFTFVESSNTDLNFNNLMLSQSDEAILIYNSNEYASNQIMADLALIRKAQLKNNKLKISCVILNEYDKNKTEHINALMNLKKVFNTNIFVLPFNENLNKESKTAKIYLEKNPWSDFAIKVDEIVNIIINN